MTKKLISLLAIIVVSVCLISGGCKVPEEQDLKSWKDLLNIKPENVLENKGGITPDLGDDIDVIPNLEEESEKITIQLYFIGPDGKKLAVENRTITKKEGLARSTIEELIKGPEVAEHLAVFPEGTRLLDINIKPEGRCIINLSSQLTEINNEHQEKLMVYALVNTLGQFASVQDVDILINGDKVETIAGYIDVSVPIEPDYSI
ncbi:MAG TPA: GerMN domain-containing protein [Syntrophomonadaceae bacterium]|nr:GerMN domain-containing protein [Syntrophomonadaceae bacterium]